MRISKSTRTSVKATKEVTASNWAGTKKIFDTHGGDSQLNDRTGQTVTVIRPLTRTEADITDVGPMFKVRFEDGYETDAFEDELSDITSCNSTIDTDKALQHITAAIDILGKSGKKDDVTKDIIANLAVVAMDIKASRK